MNKTIAFIVIVVLLALAGIISFAKQNFSLESSDRSTPVNSEVNSDTGSESTIPSQTNNNQSSPSPTEQDLRDEIEKDLNEIEKSLNEADSSLDDSDLNF